MSSIEKSWAKSYGSGLLDAVEQEMRAVGLQEGERLITKVLEFKGVNDQGDLKGSVNTKVDRDGNSVQLQVGPDVEHAIYVLEGTRPHMAPIEPLKAWARRKLGDEQAGYAVQKKIAREGTDPVDFLTGPAQKLIDIVPSRLEGAMADTLDNN